MEKNLKKRVTQYKLDDFYKMLESKKFKMDQQLLDTLIDLSDFNNFKEMMLNYKRSKTNNKKAVKLRVHVQKHQKMISEKILIFLNFWKIILKKAKNKFFL